jgi:hypothetical protein
VGGVDGVGRDFGDGHAGFAIAAVFGMLSSYSTPTRLGEPAAWASSASSETVLEQRRRAVLFGIEREFDARAARVVVAEEEGCADSAGGKRSESGEAQRKLAETCAQDRSIGSS